MKMCMKQCSVTNMDINGLGEEDFPIFENLTANLFVVIDGEVLYLNLTQGVATLDPEPRDSWFFNGDGLLTFIFNVENSRFLAFRNAIGLTTLFPSDTFFVNFACIENSFRISTLFRNYLVVKPFNDGFLVTFTEEIEEATIFTAENISLTVPDELLNIDTTAILNANFPQGDPLSI